MIRDPDRPARPRLTFPHDGDAERGATPRATESSARAAQPPTIGVRMVAAVLLALLAVAVLVTPASAHGVLTSATPTDGAELDAAPDEVVLTFNEPVEAGDQALRLFDADGTRVDDGPLETPADEIGVATPADLPDGAYVVAYRVTSDDGHPIAGVTTFTVGDAAPLDAASAAAIGGADDGMTGVAGAVLRGAGYLAVLLAAGAVAFAATVAVRAGDRRRAARLGAVAAVAGLVATALHLPVQAAAVTGRGLGVVADPTALGAVLSSGFGVSALVRAAGLVALLAAWWPRRTTGERGPGVVLWLGGVATLGSYLLDGHQRTVEPAWLLLSGDAVHLAGAAVWAGGLALLYATLTTRRRDDDPAGAARLVARFSGVALWSVLALSVAGAAMSLPLVRSLDALTSTTYGWVLLAKVTLVVVVLGVATYNRRTLVPAVVVRAVPAGASVDTGTDPDAPTAGRAGDPAADSNAEAWRRLAGTVRLELVIVVLVGLLTGFLATTQPAAEAAGLTGPVVETAALSDDLDLDLIIDPAEPGLNAVHIYVVDAAGQPVGDVEDLRLEFTYLDEGVGPIEVEPFVAGPGHWTGNIGELTFAGSWEVRVIAAEDRFTERTATIPFQLGG